MSLADSELAIFSCLCLHIQDVLWEAYFSCPAWQTHPLPHCPLGPTKPVRSKKRLREVGVASSGDQVTCVCWI